jgi:hypothetical protein
VMGLIMAGKIVQDIAKVSCQGEVTS